MALAAGALVAAKVGAKYGQRSMERRRAIERQPASEGDELPGLRTEAELRNSWSSLLVVPSANAEVRSVRCWTWHSRGGVMATSVRIVGLGGSLRAASTSRSALQVVLDGAAASGAEVQLLWVRNLNLPLYNSDDEVPTQAHDFAETVYACDAMVWSTPNYHGSVSGSFKNALDWLILLADRDPPYLSNKPVGLVTAAGGTHGLQAINSMDFIARALRGWSVPLVMPVAQSWHAFDAAGHLTDEAVAAQLRALGEEVARAARQFKTDGTCDYAQDLPYIPDQQNCRPQSE
jgi:FMN reductase